ncbi:hypothetical protein N7448_005539 [Penicillium atrosanguineum]|nr:hypothetical protein N7448_005539 [Penicillium atrosanguineum]
MNRLPVSSLMSPPESKPMENFHPYPRRDSTSEMDLPSPPVTPYTGNKKRRSHTSEQIERDAATARDPLLFPRHDSTAAASDEPLFGPIPPPAAEALVAHHMNSHMARFENKRNKPTRDEYLLALSCVPIVSTQYNRNPAAWAREERETLERQMPPPGELVWPLRVFPESESSAPPNLPPKQHALDSFDSPPSASKPRALGTNRDDTDFHALKDFSPPLDTLGGNAKALKADWKGQMLDLSNDPDRHLLSPAELNLASTLRLSCATYLCSKRRIFEARVRALGVGKEFRKTDAQQACKIDVNKASKLWTAYERVGWFKPDFFQQYVR